MKWTYLMTKFCGRTEIKTLREQHTATEPPGFIAAVLIWKMTVFEWVCVCAHVCACSGEKLDNPNKRGSVFLSYKLTLLWLLDAADALQGQFKAGLKKSAGRRNFIASNGGSGVRGVIAEALIRQVRNYFWIKGSKKKKILLPFWFCALMCFHYFCSPQIVLL